MSSFRALEAAEYLAAAELAEINDAMEQAFDMPSIDVWDILRAAQRVSRSRAQRGSKPRPAKPKKKC